MKQEMKLLKKQKVDIFVFVILTIGGLSQS